MQALNPLLVFTLTPILLAIWKRRAGRPFSPLRRMAVGAAIVALLSRGDAPGELAPASIATVGQ